MTSPFEKLTVIGTGLIGGSFLMACRENFSNLKIRAVDTNQQTLQFLVKHSLVDEVSQSVPTDFETSELVILATHLKTSLTILEQIAPHIKKNNGLVSDIGSCKRAIFDLGAKLLPQHFIAGHPLAGKEVSGINNATSLLFAGKPYALCQPENFDSEPVMQQKFNNLKQFLEQGLRARVGTLMPGQHDRYMAYVSHFPQLYAVMLTTLLYRNEPGNLLEFHGAGIDDQLRLAASPYEMWRDVFDLNEDNLRRVIREFAGLFKEADAALNKADMQTWFEHANEIHKEFQEFKGSLRLKELSNK